MDVVVKGGDPVKGPVVTPLDIVNSVVEHGHKVDDTSYHRRREHPSLARSDCRGKMTEKRWEDGENHGKHDKVHGLFVYGFTLICTFSQ